MADERDEITVADAYRLYPDEWVLLQITKRHNDYRREKGRVLAHSPSRDELDTPSAQFRAEHPDALTFEWFIGDAVPEGVVVVL